MTASTKNLVSQSEFARLKGVSRKTVSAWRVEQKLVFSGKLVDVQATQHRMLTFASHKAKGARRPVTPPAIKVTGDPPRYADGVTYDNPANLPEDVANMASAISSGASEMARLLRAHMSATSAKPLVAAWVKAMRMGYAGGLGMPEAVADIDWPEPPIGFARWSDHPLFLGDPLDASDWEEIEADLVAGDLQKVSA